MYEPGAFGLFALFASIVNPICVFSNLGYSSAIMLPKSDKIASNVLAVCLFFTVLISVLSAAIIFFCGETISHLLKIPELYNYLWLIPVNVFLVGLYFTLRYWNMRKKRFGHISIANIVQYISNNGIILGAGLSGYATGFSLILGSIISVILSPMVLSRRILRGNKELFKNSIRWHKMLASMKRFKKFPKYIIWNDLISRLSAELPIYFIAVYFSRPVIGFYSLGLRLLRIPMGMLGNSIGEVYFQRESQNKEINPLLLEKLFRNLVIFGLPPFFLFCIISEDLFSIVFGTNWSEAGVYAQILSLLIFIQFITIPASYLMLIFEKQEFSLILNIAVIVTTIIAITIGGLLNNIYISFFLLTLLNGLVYAIYGFNFMNYAGLTFNKIFKIISHNFIISLPIFILVSLAKWHFQLSSLIIILISVFVMIIFYSVFLRQDEDLRQIILQLLRKISFLNKKGKKKIYPEK